MMGTSQAKPFERWVPLALLLTAIVIAYFDTAASMVAIWSRSDTFAHGFLVPPIVAWLVWRRRTVLNAIDAKPQWWMLVPMAGMAFVWLIGELAASNAVTQFAFTALLVLAVPAVMGLAFTRALLFPLCFLFFAVPFGEFLLPRLMEWTADFTVAALHLSGIPVYREGLHFVIPTGNWSVVEACSGVRYLIASVMVGALFAYLNYRSLKRRIAFVAVAIVVPIIANWVRAYMIVMLGHLSNNKLAAGVDHLIYGWLFFGVVIGLMFLVGARWSEDAEPSSEAAGLRRPSARLAPSFGFAMVLIAGVVLALPHLAVWNVQRLEVAAGKPELSLPKVLSSGWSEQENQAVWKPSFENPAIDLSRRYAAGDESVGVYLGYYRNQRYDHKLVSSENVMVRSNDARWAKVAAGSRQVKFGDSPVTLQTTTLRAQGAHDATAGSRMLAWQVYWVNGTLTSNDAWAKLLGALYKVGGQGDDAALIVFYTSDTPDNRAPLRLQAFVEANHAIVEEQLRAARDRKFELARPNGIDLGAKL